MRSKFLGYVIALTVMLPLASAAVAQPKNRKGTASGSSSNDKNIEKQMEWEKKVMGDDSAKAADMRKIAAAQKLADEAAKNPPPVQAPKHKDPNKEGVRAKQEAAIGLPIASDQDTRTTKKSTGNSKKSHAPTSSADDELGALVATSLAEEKSTGNTSSAHHSKPHNKGARGKGHAKAPPSTLDKMFATSN